ncbi:MAG: AraC family transcriptional regulator [Synergistaceae bacterium]|nr:AraC family transcriptional regulator [Synergistaceae bacterium]
MERYSYEVYRPIDKESERLGFEVRWAGEVWRGKFEFDRYHKRFLLIYTYGGACLYDDGERFLELKPGSLMVYKPYQRQHFKVDDDRTQLHTYGLSFSGGLVEKIVSEMPFAQKSIHALGVSDYLAKSISNLIRQMMIVPVSRSEVVWGELLRVLGDVNELVTQEAVQDRETQKQLLHLKNAEEYIVLNYNQELKIEKIAKTSGYSVSWFEKLFRKRYGVSPITYQMRLRVEKARDMIRSGIFNLNLTEIGLSVGFSDPLYFSKVFKKYMGVSPKQYRMTETRLPR